MHGQALKTKTRRSICEGCTTGRRSIGQNRGGTMALLTDLRRSIKAATAVEYGLILAVIFVGAIGAISQFSDGAIGLWNFVATTSVEAMNPQ